MEHKEAEPAEEPREVTFKLKFNVIGSNGLLLEFHDEADNKFEPLCQNFDKKLAPEIDKLFGRPKKLFGYSKSSVTITKTEQTSSAEDTKDLVSRQAAKLCGQKFLFYSKMNEADDDEVEVKFKLVQDGAPEIK